MQAHLPARLFAGFQSFNPIEQAFSKIKAFLKKVAARIRGALIEAIAQALRGITVGEIRGWFAHCGYVIEDQPS